MSAMLVKCVGYTAAFIILITVISTIIYAVKTPSNNKNWTLGNTKTASINIDGNQVKIKNFRDADWRKLKPESLKNDDDLFRDIEFQLDQITSLHAMVSHFAILSEIAHIFIFFELKDNTMIGLSVEARKEQGEEYSLSGGLSAKFELIYIMASYRDLVGLRLMREEGVYSYPIKASAEEAQALFKVAADRANKINQHPEFYHLFLKNCTTQIVDLVNQIAADTQFPRITQSFFPGDAGKALFKMDLIDTELTDFKEIQKVSLLKE